MVPLGGGVDGLVSLDHNTNTHTYWRRLDYLLGSIRIELLHETSILIVFPLISIPTQKIKGFIIGRDPRLTRPNLKH